MSSMYINEEWNITHIGSVRPGRQQGGAMARSRTKAGTRPEAATPPGLAFSAHGMAWPDDQLTA